MKKPNKKQVENATDAELAEWSAVYVMEWHLVAYSTGDYFHTKEESLVHEPVKHWNPAQNIGQAMELVEKFDSWLINKHLGAKIVCVISVEHLKTVSAKDKKKERAITIASLLAVMELGKQ